VVDVDAINADAYFLAITTGITPLSGSIFVTELTPGKWQI
jgi:hypothetical protein